MNGRIAIAALATLVIVACRPATAVAGADGSAQSDPAAGLGVTFDRGPGLQARPCEDGMPRCVILVDPAVPDFMQELLRLEVHDGPLDAVAADQAGFVRNADGRLMTTYGRFEPVEVEAFEVNGKSGLRAAIACGISDPDTGFHAGAGECLWIVVSDGTRSVLIASAGFENGFDAAETILASLRFPPR